MDVSKPREQRIIAKSTVDFPQHYPQPGWVEHDLDEIWVSIEKAASQALHEAGRVKGDFKKEYIIAIGITNQRETLCVFDRMTARPVAKGIVWQCRRSSEICRRLRDQKLDALFRQKTGLVLDPYFSGTKITWLMENDSQVATKVKRGEAVLSTIDGYLVCRLTAGKTFATEASNASRTLLFDINRGQFDAELCEILKVPGLNSLPEVKDSAAVFGHTKGLGFLPDGIPIAGILGDQQAALAGQTCFDVGEAKCTYGTGAFLLANIGRRKLDSTSQLLTTVAWSLKGTMDYAFEGSAFIAGAAIQFIRDQCRWLPSAKESESLASPHYAAPHQYFVPALTGLGAPYWDPHARGAFLGLTRGSTSEEFIRTVLEGIAFQVCDLLRCMAKDLKSDQVSPPDAVLWGKGQGSPQDEVSWGKLKVLRVDGGAAANNLLMQIQADLADITVDRPVNVESTAFGAGLFAGLGIGLYQSLSDLRTVRRTDRLFEPNREPAFQAERTKYQLGWKRAIAAVKLFAEEK